MILSIPPSHTFKPPSHTHGPEYAKAGLCAVCETTEAEALASLKVSQNKGKVLHGHAIPHSEQRNVVRGGHMKNKQARSKEQTSQYILTFVCHMGSRIWALFDRTPGKWEIIVCVKFNMKNPLKRLVYSLQPCWWLCEAVVLVVDVWSVLSLLRQNRCSRNKGTNVTKRKILL